MIFGIGTDIVEIERIEQALEKHGNAFAEKILSENEYQIFLQENAPAKYLAKRFAAKEAAAKAFGSGFRNGLSLQHIEVQNNSVGAPRLKFYAKAKNLIAMQGINNVCLTLSDEKSYAVAFVTMEYSPQNDSG